MINLIQASHFGPLDRASSLKFTFESIFQEQHQSVIEFGSRSGLMFCQGYQQGNKSSYKLGKSSAVPLLHTDLDTSTYYTVMLFLGQDTLSCA